MNPSQPKIADITTEFDQLEGPAFRGQEFDEAKSYLEKYRILDIIQQLMASLLIERPGISLFNEKNSKLSS